MKRLFAAALLLSLVAAGCGGGGSTSSGGGTSNATAGSSHGATPTSAGPAFPSAAAKAAAQQALLTINDFPTGWSTSKDTSSEKDSGQAAKELAKCLNVPASLLDSSGSDAAKVDSPDFQSPDTSATVSETMSVSASTRVSQLFSVLKQPSAADCLSTALNTLVKELILTSTDSTLKQAKVGTVQVGQLSTGHFGDDTVGFRTSVPIEASGLTLTAYIDVEYVRHANAVASLMFEDVGTPLDAATANQVTQRAAQKLTSTSFPPF